MNAAWHAKHRLSRTATTTERAAWHVAHAAACACRPIPASVQADLEMNRRTARRRPAAAARPRSRGAHAASSTPAATSATHPNADAFPPGLSGPALRALANAGIQRLEDLADWSATELRALHGLGPKGIAVLRAARAESGASHGGQARRPRSRRDP